MSINVSRMLMDRLPWINIAVYQMLLFFSKGGMVGWKYLKIMSCNISESNDSP